MRKVVRIPAGNTNYVHYIFVVLKPLVIYYSTDTAILENLYKNQKNVMNFGFTEINVTSINTLFKGRMKSLEPERI